MKKKETEEQAIERRKKMYGCNGKCYCDSIWDEDLKCMTQATCCGRIDTCEETRFGEFIATILAILTIIAIPIAIVGFLIFCICR